MVGDKIPILVSADMGDCLWYPAWHIVLCRGTGAYLMVETYNIEVVGKVEGSMEKKARLIVQLFDKAAVLRALELIEAEEVLSKNRQLRGSIEGMI